MSNRRRGLYLWHESAHQSKKEKPNPARSLSLSTAAAKTGVAKERNDVLLRAIVRSSSKIYTARTATSSLYRCSSLRTFCGAVENNNNNNNKSNKEASELKSAVLNANKAIFDAEQRVYDHERVIRDLSVRVTNLSLSKSRLDEAIESNDIEQILAAIQDMEHHLAIEYVSSRRNDCSFPTELTSLLLQRFGGQASAWVGRYLRVYQMKTLKYQVNPHDVSDQAANLTLARAIVSALVLSLVIYLYSKLISIANFVNNQGC
ncbi:hypothetical protein F2Q69_00055221 [Brassica cretica]|uniref:Uncharacterized protein n=1 Tax=Brassica cretica TaxID=69181 RepID=A0A8S9MT85_BRACR|nr:hypothetical protein F2Q69_00055221 [Brassica cretica]